MVSQLSPLGSSGFFALPQVVAAWLSAGSPTVNDGWRSTADQESDYQTYLNGGAAADNPDDPSLPRAHMRGAAIDVNATPAQTQALLAAGLVRPYPDEPWHFQLPGYVTQYPIIPSLNGAVVTTAANVSGAQPVNQKQPGNGQVWSDMVIGISTPVGSISTGIHTRILMDIGVGIVSLLLFATGIALLAEPDISSLTKKLMSGDLPIPIPV